MRVMPVSRGTAPGRGCTRGGWPLSAQLWGVVAASPPLAVPSRAEDLQAVQQGRLALSSLDRTARHLPLGGQI